MQNGGGKAVVGSQERPLRKWRHLEGGVERSCVHVRAEGLGDRELGERYVWQGGLGPSVGGERARAGWLGTGQRHTRARPGRTWWAFVKARVVCA